MPEFRPDAPDAISACSTSVTRAPAAGQERGRRAADDPAADHDDVGSATRDHADRSPLGDARQRFDDPIDLTGRVVVGQADADDAAQLREPQPLDQPGRVEVAVPGRDAFPTERLRDRSGRAGPRS